eukprot:CAMPEP_0172796298 /NCGR_PEP_ID=MMETSP1074-20121228/210916_1 /TAXON_ID=2916 /ORGANISM="Ceratium fusus, Strain PA161109" /LENGTH=159 /DNA_ID=CAMNT_0013633391 /DNA_START=211 /DNA_END=691 /DNA_ORIENTATION=-
MTDFHPETWNPAWSVETILVGLLSFFLSERKMGFGALNEPPERRRLLADASRKFNATDAEFCKVFPDFLAVCENHAGAVEPNSGDVCHLNAEQECWICREVTDEPLVFPCSCRGSMSGGMRLVLNDGCTITAVQVALQSDHAVQFAVCHMLGKKCGRAL